MSGPRCSRNEKYRVLSFYKDKMENRIDWIDVAKGIAIILVVAGHVGYPIMGKAAIYSFHMPLFFMASGFVLFRHPEHSIKELFIRLIRGIIVPYVCFNIVTILFYKGIDIISTKPELEINMWYKLIGIAVAFRKCFSCNTMYVCRLLY